MYLNDLVLCDQSTGDKTAEKICNPERRRVMCDSQRLFHLQYKNKIYAEDVIVSESWALARMTAQAAQSCEA